MISQGEGVMSKSDKALEMKLLEAGKDLLDQLPCSTENLLQLLDKQFLCLQGVEQSPPSSIQNALSPLMKELVAERLFKHSNVHVKVAVAACIVELMRITAPEAPYNDETMKDVFRLIVSSFEDLDDTSSPSYIKRIWILGTMARCRICFVMLDLGCDALLIEMFQLFLKALRDHHSKEVFVYMENIMSLVLEDSEDIPPEMLSSILQCVKKDDEVPQVSQRLAEQVLSKCPASKLKTYLIEAAKSSALKQNEVVPRQTEDKHKAEGVKTEEEEPKNKRARVESFSLDKTAGEGEPLSGTHRYSAEPGDLQSKKLPQLWSFHLSVTKVKQCIVDTLTSVRKFRSELETKEQSFEDSLTTVRQFRSEIEKKEDGLAASLKEVDVLGEKILGINKILN